MKLADFINPQHLSPESVQSTYCNNRPFPHIIMDNFIKEDFLDKVLAEFPDLSRTDSKIEFKDQTGNKLASSGFADIGLKAFHLISFLNSNLFLDYLAALTGVEETLISDPYLEGTGYHEIKRGGMLKVHADFAKHAKIDLDRRLNLLLYLNKDWKKDWGWKS